MLFGFNKSSQTSDRPSMPKPLSQQRALRTRESSEVVLERTPLTARDIKRRVIRELNRGTRGNFCSPDFMETDTDGHYFFWEIKEGERSTGRIRVISPDERMRMNSIQKFSGINNNSPRTEVAFKVSSILNRLGMYPAPSNDEQDSAILKKNMLKQKARDHKAEIANIALNSGRNSFQFNQVTESVRDLHIGDRIFLELGWEARAYSVTVKNASQEADVVCSNGKTITWNFARCVLTYQSCPNGEDVPRQITNAYIHLPIVRWRACIVVVGRTLLEDLNRPIEKIYFDRAADHSKQ